jgi:hypothetical protein
MYMESPIPIWEHPLDDVWSFADFDCVSGAIIDYDGVYKFEMGTIRSTILRGFAPSLSDAVQTINIAYACTKLG